MCFLPHNLDRGILRDLIIAHKGTLLKAGINYRDSWDSMQNSANTSFLLISQTLHADRKGENFASETNGILKNVIQAVSAVNEALSLG